MNARAAEHAGIGACQMSHTQNTKLIHEIHEAWARDHGYRSVKPDDLHVANTLGFKHQASRTTNHKRQAPSKKAQALGRKRQAP